MVPATQGTIHNCYSSVSLRDAGDEAIFYPVDVKHFLF